MFQSAVERLQQANVEALRPEKFWVGYWSYVVKDPMGQTVELADPSPSPPSRIFSQGDPFHYVNNVGTG